MNIPNSISPADGKLGVMIVGLNGAVATTFMGGTFAVRAGLAQPIGSLTQMGTIRLGKRDDNRFPKIKDFVPLTNLSDLVFSGWDIRNQNCYESALEAHVLDDRDLARVQNELEQLTPMPGAFEQRFVTRLKGTWVKSGKNKFDLAEQIRDDIRNFRKREQLKRTVVIWCASTEIYLPLVELYNDLDTFEQAMKESHPAIAPSMLYAYAALMEGVPFINGSPTLTIDLPALMNLAIEKKVPIAGKDFKSGQTLVKTVIAPMLKARMLGLSGWFSSNILGNQDGAVLDDPDSFKTKEGAKLSVLEGILQPDLFPELYGEYYHKVRIHYYPPRGDNKEGWDNIDIFGWLKYPMQLKINFLCRDSILAAPLVLDLVLFSDFAQRSGRAGIQDWLSFYFKAPMHSPGVVPEHDLFIQLMKLKNTLRYLMGEQLITHTEFEEDALAQVRNLNCD